MSVAIATMGMFTPAGGGTRIEYIEVDRGSSDGWWLRPKPVVVVRSITDEDDKYKYDKKPIVEILKVTNISDETGKVDNDKHEH